MSNSIVKISDNKVINNFHNINESELSDLRKKSDDENLALIKLQNYVNEEINRIELTYGATFLFAQSEGKKVELVFSSGIL